MAQVPDVTFEGWYTDPYQRHQARWMSQGTPTPLVKDSGIEGTDPVGDAPFEVTPVRIGAEGSQIKRRNWGFWLVAVGVVAILGGVYLIQTPALGTHKFVPSSAELDVLSKGGTALPSDCSRQVARSVTNEGLGLQVAPGDADTEFTVYPHSVILVYGYENASPELSSKAPVCNLDSVDVGSSTEVTYLLERPGEVTVYFINSDAHVSVARIIVSASPPPSSTPGWAVMILGAASAFWGAVVLYRRNRSEPSDDLRRAGDAGRTGTFDPQQAQRAAWDALDQSSGQW